MLRNRQLTIPPSVSVHIMKKLLHILIILILSLKVYATAQVGDILIWNGDTLTIFSNPLESYNVSDSFGLMIYDKLENKDRIRNPEKYLEDYESLSSTACWRGYIALWTIINDELYLDKIFACHDQTLFLEVKDIFPDNAETQIKAFWFSGEIIIPKGECLRCVNLDYYSIYETEDVLIFSEGKLIDNIQYKNSIILDEEIDREFIYHNINWVNVPITLNKFAAVSLSIQPDMNGKIDSIITENSYTELFTTNKSNSLENIELITDQNNVFMKETIRIARLIPSWNVIIQRNKIVPSGIYILFDERMKKQYAR